MGKSGLTEKLAAFILLCPDDGQDYREMIALYYEVLKREEENGPRLSDDERQILSDTLFRVTDAERIEELLKDIK